ncbi:MAG: hypothetical protein B7Z66_12405 [Chromatiales bacterium 21-64-14]|nr:MAG: hypothetical protein B7Z66_12405 [Chromatiales bacterium 21-64-14]HQU16966.1 hypothetical protein [Gammaproteobacteria bacterium]
MPSITPVKPVTPAAKLSRPMPVPPSTESALRALGLLNLPRQRLLESLPFTLGDVTAGSETELQAAVAGLPQDVDLALQIRESNYFANVVRHAAVADTPQRAVTQIEQFLSDNPDQVWENSWVRIRRSDLGVYAARVLEEDLRRNRHEPHGPMRHDAHRFLCKDANGKPQVRVPISYLLKLSLAQVVGSREPIPALIEQTARRLMKHYLNDHCSPETLSFHISRLRPETGMGDAVARETAKRFLLTHLLVLYANMRFGLRESGQAALVYCSPHPPVRQRRLNDCISDTFYRELFVSPCLSGWEDGERKHAYMMLCHEVLSRSQFNAVSKLREAGIITRDLVVLPNLSNVSLANNGTHVSLGSIRLRAALQDPGSGFGAREEKCLGDLAIKISEHFLPLFAGNYSAAPYRIDFHDFHPEKVLAFLPHELDYTHLRMLWRGWRQKASLRFLGHARTPLGPRWLDQSLATLLRLRGDLVPDFRLIDYLVALGSTDQSPALDGTPGNDERLKRDLADLGIFDAGMSVYQLMRLRTMHQMGYSGFEGRHYSLFEDLRADLGRAVNLQTLVSVLAFKYITAGRIGHAEIPDTRFVESERRQILFATAIGLPAFYVRHDTGNRFLRRVLERTARIRPSRRYRNYLKVPLPEYRKALLRLILDDGADLAQMLGMEETLRDLRERLEQPALSAAGRLTAGILAEAGTRSALALSGAEFNRAAERYYRGPLKLRYVRDGLDRLDHDLHRFDQEPSLEPAYRHALRQVLGDQPAAGFLERIRPALLRDHPREEDLHRLICLLLISIHRDTAHADAELEPGQEGDHVPPPVRRAGNG